MLNKKILIISLSDPSREPRVIRQAESLIKQKYEVIIAGYSDRSFSNEKWSVIGLTQVYQSNSKQSYFFHRYIHICIKIMWSKMRKLIFFLLRKLVFIKSCAVFMYWNEYQSYQIYFKRIFQELLGVKIALIICHDYFTLPIADKLSKAMNCPYIIDVHEHALTQYQENKFFKKISWYVHNRAAVHSIQKKYFKKVSALTTVCDSIAESISRNYKKCPPPIVLRSVPFYSPQKFRAFQEGNSIKFLYHGLVCKGRGLEEIIFAIKHSCSKVSLMIRGQGDDKYLRYLKDLVTIHALQSKVYFEQYVPFDSIISEANQYDVGIFVYPKVSLQKQYALPNKFFEYIMAGLCLCVYDAVEIEKIVKKYNVGYLVRQSNPMELAKVIDSMTVEKINFYKKQSLIAATELCWERESVGFNNLIEQVLN